MRLIRVIRDEIGGVNVWHRGSRKGCECSQRRSGRIRDSFENRLPQAFVVLATSDYAWDTVRRNQDVAPVAQKFLHRIEHALCGSKIPLCYEGVYVWQILLNDCGMTIDPRLSHDVGPRRV